MNAQRKQEILTRHSTLSGRELVRKFAADISRLGELSARPYHRLSETERSELRRLMIRRRGVR